MKNGSDMSREDRTQVEKEQRLIRKKLSTGKDEKKHQCEGWDKTGWQNMTHHAGQEDRICSDRTWPNRTFVGQQRTIKDQKSTQKFTFFPLSSERRVKIQIFMYFMYRIVIIYYLKRKSEFPENPFRCLS